MSIDLEITRGCSKLFPFIAQDQDGDPIDLTNAIIKVHVKEDMDDANENAILSRTSYNTREIVVTDDEGGAFTMKFWKPDTIDLEPGGLVWDCEITRRGDENVDATDGATCEVADGSDEIVGTDSLFSLARVGDVVDIGAGAQGQCTIVEIVDDEHVIVDRDSWDDASGLAIAIYDGNVKTPATGLFTVAYDVTR